MLSIRDVIGKQRHSLKALSLVICILLTRYSISMSQGDLPAPQVQPKLIFWYNGQPGYPPPGEWRNGDNAKSLYKEMQYGNMSSRPGSKEYFTRLKALGFDEVFLNGFAGPYNPQKLEPKYPGDLSAFSQTRNYSYYIPWARQAGLEPSLQIMFFNNAQVEDFSWFDDKVWIKIDKFIRFAAMTAKNTGCKGVSLELEPYNVFTLHNPWIMSSRENKGYTRAAFLNAIKKRSAQMASAIFSEFPDAQVHVYGIGVGADSFIMRRRPASVQDYNGDDFGDIVAYFLAGLYEKNYPGKICIDEGSTYGVFKASEIKRLYDLAQMKYIDNTLSRWDLTSNMEGRISIGLALVAHHRWDSPKWWDKVKVVDEPTMEMALTALLKTAPYVWVYPGEVDWIYPELADTLPTSNAMTLEGSPYSSYSERMMALNGVFRRTISLKKSKPSFSPFTYPDHTKL